MPLLKVCRCGSKIDYNAKACSKCLAKREQEKKDKVKRYDKTIRNSIDNKKYVQFYNSKDWERCREDIHRYYGGICLYSYVIDGEIKKADVVHHIKPLKLSWEERLMFCNLIPLSHDAHNYIESLMDTNPSEAIRLGKRVKEEWEKACN